MAAGRGYRRRPRLAALAFAALLLPLSGALAQSGGEDVQYDRRSGGAGLSRGRSSPTDAGAKRRSEERRQLRAPTFSKPDAGRGGPLSARNPRARTGATRCPGSAAPRPPTIPAPASRPGRRAPPEARAVADEPPERPRRAEPPRRRKNRESASESAAPRARRRSSAARTAAGGLNEPPARRAWLEYAREEPAEGGRAGPGERRAAPVLPAALAGLQVGKGLYARTLYEANSDWPGPVVLEILEPPLAGAVATGAFQEAGERLVIRIDRFSLGRQSWEIEGWAVDPGCACYGIPGEVDRHWFERVLLPSALAFAGGFLDAAARTAQIVTRDAAGNSITVESGAPSHRQQVYAGAAEAARRAGAVLLESVRDGPTVRVPARTPDGLARDRAPRRAEGRCGGHGTGAGGEAGPGRGGRSRS